MGEVLNKPNEPEKEKQTLVSNDIQNIVFDKCDYDRYSRTTEYDFDCDIHGKHNSLQYTLEYHDDGESFGIYSEEDNICDIMSLSELYKLKDRLDNEALYGRYHKKISGAKDMAELEEIEFEIMEERSPYFMAVYKRIWNDYSEKKEKLLGDGVSGCGVEENQCPDIRHKRGR